MLTVQYIFAKHILECVPKQLSIAWRVSLPNTLKRNISALYITGDKAKENYVTLQPFMDFKGTLSDIEALDRSITARGWQMDLSEVMQKYAQYQNLAAQIKKVETDREAVTNKLKQLVKSPGPAAKECDSLKELGKALRNTLKTLKEKNYPLEDDFVHAFLNLPSTLHADCPQGGNEKLLYRSPVPPRKQQAPSHLENKELIQFLNNSCYYMISAAAEFDLFSLQAITNYFVDVGGFHQIANPDFVRRVLLEANATQLEHYHLVLEEQLLNKINPAYLTGSGTFEGFLGAFTKLCIYPSVLPLRLVACGRSYEKEYVCAVQKKSAAKRENLFTATQMNAVQTFVAVQSAQEADRQLDEILNLAVNFYKEIGVHFRIVYADASTLTAAECLRAVIEVYSPAEQRYVCVGRISNYSDFVSKRILFSMRQQKGFHFLHLIGGPVLYTARLVAVLIELGVKLEDCQLLGSLDEMDNKKAINEFKNIFK